MEASIVVNATGMNAKTFVPDADMKANRGRVVLVRG